MKFRAGFCAFLAVALTPLAACSSSGSSGHLLPGPGAGSTVAVGNAGPSVSTTTGGGSAAAAGSSGVASTSIGGGGGGGAFCGKLKAAQLKLASLSETSDPSNLSKVIDQQIAAFKDLKDGAPAKVSAAIDDLIQVLNSAKAAFADPSHPDVSKLQGLSQKLPADSETIASYVASNCAGG